MKTNVLLSLAVLILGAMSLAGADYPPAVMEGTQLIPLKSKLNQRPYELFVSLPYSYGDADSQKRYPVLYVLDGYWDGRLLHTMYGNMVYDQSVPEYILVGIGYSDPSMDPDRERMLDLSWETLEGMDMPTGGGRDFLKIIREEIIPLVDSTFRTDPSWRVLGGSSMGGYFALHTLFEDPEAFQAYVSISPAVNVGRRALFQIENDYRTDGEFQRGNTELPARLFMSAAGEEWEDFRGGILAFDQILRHGGYSGFEYEFRLVDGERHAGTKPEGYSRGVRYAMRPYMDTRASASE